jgi:hypothetical protein
MSEDFLVNWLARMQRLGSAILESWISRWLRRWILFIRSLISCRMRLTDSARCSGCGVCWWGRLKIDVCKSTAGNVSVNVFPSAWRSVRTGCVKYWCEWGILVKVVNCLGFIIYIAAAGHPGRDRGDVLGAHVLHCMVVWCWCQTQRKLHILQAYKAADT